jgi:hypothetical protein
MASAAIERNVLSVPLVGAAAVALGWLIAVEPGIALGGAGALAAFALAFLFPVAHLAAVLVLLAIVPFETQNVYGLGGGTGEAGLVASDVLLLTGTLRAMWVLPRLRLGRLQLAAVLLTIALLLIAAAQFAHGIRAGYSGAAAGTELRAILGFAALLIALPIVVDPAGRRRLMGALLAVGLALGAWGVAQWVLGVSFGETGDVGIREGVEFTTEGRGQLLGGLFGFPVAVIVGFAVLVSGRVRSPAIRFLVVAMVVLNVVCVLLTYERTFWLVTLAACALVALRAGSVQRLRTLVWTPILAVLVLVPLATLAPRDLATAGERLLSLREYSSDASLSYRIIESEHVLAEIRDRPGGSGLGATIYWGRPANDIPPSEYTFSHNGFLRIAWKLGIPAAILLFCGLLAAGLRRGRAAGSAPGPAFVSGCQAALLALVAICVTFPSVTALSSTAVQGTLVAFALLPRAPRGRVAGARLGEARRRLPPLPAPGDDRNR